MALSMLYQTLLFTFFTIASAQSGSVYTLQNDGTQAFSLGLALNTTSNDIHFSMTAPSTYSWLAFGIGGQMRNALMFIGYPSSSGTGVTLSPRLATGHSQPIYTDTMDVEVVDSSITNGAYQIAAICRNCTTWSLGTMDTTATDQPFILALGPTGETISSDSTSENIAFHTIYDGFSLNMQQAAFTGNQAPAVVTNGAAAASSGDSPNVSTGTAGGGYSSSRKHIYRVHGIFMAIAFVILFPAAVIALRFLENVILHAAINAFAYCFVIVGLGTGIHLTGSGTYNTAHQIIGLLLFSLIAIQALGGLLHHIIYRRTGKRTPIGKIHMFLGIALLILGIVNTPLGLNLAGDSKYNKYYVIVVSILGAAFLAARFWKVWDNRKKAKMTQSEKDEEALRRGSSNESRVK